MEEKKTTTITTEANLLDSILEGMVVAEKPVSSPPAIEPASEKQIRFFASLAQQAVQRGIPVQTPPADKAGMRIAIMALDAMLKAPAQYVPRVQTSGGGKPPTSKQWAMIRHLRDSLKDIGEGWARTLANEVVENDIRAASNYISRVLSDIKRRYQSDPRTRRGGYVCSYCYKPGCRIGPMKRVEW